MPSPNIKIVLDSCILIYSVDQHTRESTNVILDKFKTNKNRLVYSSVSAFEVLKNRQEQENEAEYSALLNRHYRIPVDTPVLANASTLYFLYKQTNKIQQSKKDSFKLDPKDKLTGDLIVGGTAISYTNHWLLTSNKKDFPEEYWKTKMTNVITSTDGQKISVYLLEPDMNRVVKNLKDTPKDTKKWPSQKNIYPYRG